MNNEIYIELIVDENKENDKQSQIKSLNFVFYNDSYKKWYNNNSKDFQIRFISIINSNDSNESDVPEFVNDIIKCEVEYGSWTLMHRYNKCYDILNSIDINNQDCLLWLYIWLRYSYCRQLDWQRSFNTKPKELAHSMNRLTCEITAKYCHLSKLMNGNTTNTKDSTKFNLSTQNLLRMMLSLLGKGNGDGQKIRDEILQIMHRHKIKETNDHFYEQWHQKLHNNTTPDDVIICQALIEYLKSNGNMNVYWKVLNSNGITRERLAKFERRITYEPYHKPELIPSLENFLFTLKAVHSSDDIGIMFNSAKYILNGNDYNKINEVLCNIHHWDTLKQIFRVTDSRDLINNCIIKGNINDANRVRDLLFLDLCLENYLRQLVEKIIHIDLEFSNYINEITAIIKNLNFNYDYGELKICMEDWISLTSGSSTSINVNTALKIKSVSDRLSRSLSHIIDYFNTKYEPKSKLLGNRFNAEKYVVDLFSEETLRGSVFFTLSMVLKKLEPVLRKSANLGEWLIISRGDPTKTSTIGCINFVKSLHEVQFKNYKSPTVLLTSQVGGNEEIPVNVICLVVVLSRDYPDILAHVSVRARNLSVPLLVCFDDNISEGLMKMEGKSVRVKIGNRNAEFVECEANMNSMNNGNCGLDNSDGKDGIQSIKSMHAQAKDRIPEGFPKVILRMHEFNDVNVGKKAYNTKVVYGNLPKWVRYPESIAIPFNVCEYFLDLEENFSVKQQIEVSIIMINIVL